jgi:hypothetical protein
MLVSGLCATPVQAQYWQNADLTAMTGGPDAMFFSSMAIAFDPAWNVMRTHYLGYDRHVHELYLYGGQWREADLTAMTGGPLAKSGTTLAIAFDSARNTMRTHYVDNNKHVRELYLSGGQWREADLTAMTGGHLASGALAMAFDPIWGGTRTHYVCTSAHVHELFIAGSQWQDANLSAMTGGPSAGGLTALAMVFDPVWNGMRTHYFAADGHVHELFLNAGRWQDADLTAIAGGPVSYGIIRSAFDPAWNAVRTVYVVSNGMAQNAHVHELSLHGGQWRNADLTAIAGAPALRSFGDIAFDPRWNTMRVHFAGNDGHVRELFLAGGRWQHADLTAITGAPAGAGPIAMVFDLIWNGIRTHYVNADEHINEMFLVP